MGLLAAFALTSAGCGRKAADLERQARGRREVEDIRGALELYHEVLEADPRRPLAHLQAGILYEQYDLDLLRAIYHLERYLELDPGEGKQQELVRQIIERARLAYATTIPDQPSGAVRELAARDRQIAGLRERVAELEAELAREREAAREARAALAARPPPPPRPTPDPRPPAASPTAGRSYVVKSGDTLSGIARAVYGDAGQWNRILEANQPMLRSPQDLRPGQTITIPP